MTEKTYFRGRFYIKLDAKGRLLLPLPFRMGQEFCVTTNRYGTLVCLDGLRLKDWKKFEEHFLRQKNRNLKEQFYFSGAFLTELDTHQRLQLPSHLRQYAGLKGKVILVGVGEKFEIWAEDEWKKFSDNLFKDFKDDLSSLALKEL